MQYELKEGKFWENVRIGRARYDITQQQVADELGVKESTFSQWESGKRRLPAGRFMVLCHMLDLDPMDYYRSSDLPAWKKPKASAAQVRASDPGDMSDWEYEQYNLDDDGGQQEREILGYPGSDADQVIVSGTDDDDEDYDPPMGKIFEDRAAREAALAQVSLGTEYVYRTPDEIARFDQLDLAADAPAGYHREQADISDYWKYDWPGVE